MVGAVNQQLLGNQSSSGTSDISNEYTSVNENGRIENLHQSCLPHNSTGKSFDCEIGSSKELGKEQQACSNTIKNDLIETERNVSDLLVSAHALIRDNDGDSKKTTTIEDLSISKPLEIQNSVDGVLDNPFTLQNHRSIITSSQLKTGTDEKPKPLVASPKQAMVLYMNKLTPYEHHEIFKYPQIYFIGANAKKRPGIAGPNNSDYDNDQGSYIHIPHDHIAYRYEVLKIIGKGSFGQVIKAYDHKTHEHIALKMVRNEKRFHRQAQEEIRILSHLRKHDKENSMNIIHMFDYFTFRNHMCITFELLYINLYELIKKNKFQGFSLQLVRKFAHSLLQCLDALSKNKIIHCDMKPENVLLKQQGRSGIKVNIN